MAAAPVIPEIFRRRRAGVLMHLTSVPGPHGVGDLGPASDRFAQWCAEAGLSLWQMLPIGPVGYGESPYSATSSFAAEPMLVSLERLAEQGLLPKSRLKAPAALGRGDADFAAARAFKRPRFAEAFENFRRKGGLRGAAFRAFERRTRDWLPGWCRFAAAKEGGPRELHAFVQFQFERQWGSFRERCHALGVRLVGDLPIFVTLDSADVADRPELFRLERNGRPKVVTGVPPDCFSADGQLWGHPHYAWAAHRREGFRWWMRRVATALERFDALRIDHFVGFVHAYEIPGTAKTARRGRWAPTPGRELLTAIERRLGRLTETTERGEIGDGEIGQDLAIDLDAGSVETGDEPAVADVVQTARGVDALNPEATELALLGATVAERVLTGLHHLLVGGADGTALVAVVTLGALENLTAALLGVDCTLDSCHDWLPSLSFVQS